MSTKKSAKARTADAASPNAESSNAPSSDTNAVREVDSYEPPSDWISVPMERPPFWSPSRSTKPLVGVVMSKIRMEAERCYAYLVRLTEPTDAVFEGGLVEVSAEKDVVLPAFFDLLPIDSIVNHASGALFQVSVSRPKRIGDKPDDWQFVLRVNPNGIPKSELGLK